MNMRKCYLLSMMLMVAGYCWAPPAVVERSTVHGNRFSSPVNANFLPSITGVPSPLTPRSSRFSQPLQPLATRGSKTFSKKSTTSTNNLLEVPTLSRSEKPSGQRTRSTQITRDTLRKDLNKKFESRNIEITSKKPSEPINISEPVSLLEQTQKQEAATKKTIKILEKPKFEDLITESVTDIPLEKKRLVSDLVKQYETAIKTTEKVEPQAPKSPRPSRLLMQRASGFTLTSPVVTKQPVSSEPLTTAKPLTVTEQVSKAVPGTYQTPQVSPVEQSIILTEGFKQQKPTLVEKPQVAEEQPQGLPKATSKPIEPVKDLSAEIGQRLKIQRESVNGKEEVFPEPSLPVELVQKSVSVPVVQSEPAPIEQNNSNVPVTPFRPGIPSKGSPYSTKFLGRNAVRRSSRAPEFKVEGPTVEQPETLSITSVTQISSIPTPPPLSIDVAAPNSLLRQIQSAQLKSVKPPVENRTSINQSRDRLLEDIKKGKTLKKIDKKTEGPRKTPSNQADSKLMENLMKQIESVDTKISNKEPNSVAGDPNSFKRDPKEWD